jgi:hypothetical protein
MLKQTLFKPISPQKDYSIIEANANLTEDERASVSVAWRCEQDLISTTYIGDISVVADGGDIRRLIDVSKFNHHLVSIGNVGEMPKYNAARPAMYFESSTSKRFLFGDENLIRVNDFNVPISNPKNSLPFMFLLRGEWGTVPTSGRMEIYCSIENIAAAGQRTGISLAFDNGISSTDMLFKIYPDNNSLVSTVQVAMDTDPHTWVIYSDGTNLIMEEDGIEVDTDTMNGSTPQSQELTDCIGAHPGGGAYFLKDFYYYSFVIKNGATTPEERGFWRNWAENIPS